MEFIRKNPALAVGIGLPFLVVVFFSLAAVVPSWMVAPPQYDAVFAIRSPYCCGGPPSDGEMKFSVVKNHLKAYWRKKPKQGGGNPDIRLYLFDAKTLSTRELSLPPTSSKSDDWEEFSVPDTETLTLDPTTVAPDGYQFHDGYRYSGDVFPFFSGGSSREHVFIGKNGREVKLSLPDEIYPYSGDTIHFLGWVKTGSGK